MSKHLLISQHVHPLQALAYKKYQHVPLYIEWAPQGIFSVPPPTREQQQAKQQQGQQGQSQSGDAATGMKAAAAVGKKGGAASGQIGTDGEKSGVAQEMEGVQGPGVCVRVCVSAFMTFMT